MVKATIAGATPNEICRSRLAGQPDPSGPQQVGEQRPAGTYQVCERVQLLSHETALLPPPRNLAVKSIKEEAKRQETQRQPEMTERVGVAQAIAQGGEYRHDAAEAWSRVPTSKRGSYTATVGRRRRSVGVRTVEERDEVGEVHGAHEREVAYVGGQEQLLLVHGCKEDDTVSEECPLIPCWD